MLAETAEGQIGLANAGAVEVLVAFLKTSEVSAKHKQMASEALCLVASHPDNLTAAVQGGAIEPLVALVQTGVEGSESGLCVSLLLSVCACVCVVA